MLPSLIGHARSIGGLTGKILLGNFEVPKWLWWPFGLAAAAPIVGYELDTKHRMKKDMEQLARDEDAQDIAKEVVKRSFYDPNQARIRDLNKLRDMVRAAKARAEQR